MVLHPKRYAFLYPIAGEMRGSSDEVSICESLSLQDPVVKSLMLASRAECDRLARVAVDWLVRTARIDWLDRDALRRGVMAVLVNALDVEASADYAVSSTRRRLLV